MTNQDNTRPMPRRLQGKVAAVTGSSSGNGRAIALRLAAEGASVICSDIREMPLPGGFEDDIDVATHEVINRGGGQAVFVTGDVTRAEDMDAVAAAAVEHFGRLDVWVNNAGVGGFTELLDETPETFSRTFDINFRGTWNGARSAVRQMVRQDVVGRGRGRIINIGSIAGVDAQAGLSSYSVSKAAVHMLTKAVAIEFADRGITANAVAPGYLPTAMNRFVWDNPEHLEHVKAIHPYFELGTADDVAGATAFLASDDAGWVTGTVLPVDGGYLAK